MVAQIIWYLFPCGSDFHGSKRFGKTPSEKEMSCLNRREYRVSAIREDPTTLSACPPRVLHTKWSTCRRLSGEYWVGLCASQTQVDHTLEFVFKWWRAWDGEFRPDRIRMRDVRAGVAWRLEKSAVYPSTDHLLNCDFGSFCFPPS